MVDFGGWDMPLAYGSQLEEHHAVRQDAGMFDVSHMLNVDVTGPDAFAFLQRLVANDVAKLTVPGKALYSCMLNPQGGVIDDLIIYSSPPMSGASWSMPAPPTRTSPGCSASGSPASSTWPSRRAATWP